MKYSLNKWLNFVVCPIVCPGIFEQLFILNSLKAITLVLADHCDNANRQRFLTDRLHDGCQRKHFPDVHKFLSNLVFRPNSNVVCTAFPANYTAIEISQLRDHEYCNQN